MGITLEEAREKAYRTTEIGTQAQDAMRTALSPEIAVEEMKESEEYEGEFFTTSEIIDYIEQKLQDAEDINPRTEGETEYEEAANASMNYAVWGWADEIDYENGPTQDSKEEYVRESLNDSEDAREVSVEGERYFTDKETYQKFRE